MRSRNAGLFAGAGLTALMTTGLLAQAAELRPLQEVWAEEKSQAILLFVLQRCAAAYAAMATLAGSSDELKAMEEQAVFMAGTFLSVALEVDEQGGLNVSAEKIKANIVDMVPLYLAEMQANYLASGNRLEGVVADDITFCKSLGED